MKKVIYPGLASYFPTSLLAGFLAMSTLVIWIMDGPQTKAPQLFFITIGLYLIFCFLGFQRRIEITEEGITVYYPFKKKYIFWNDISRSEITVWIDPKVPFEILVYGDDPNTPLADISVILYDKKDVLYLMNIEYLKLSHSTSDESR